MPVSEAREFQAEETARAEALDGGVLGRFGDPCLRWHFEELMTGISPGEPLTGDIDFSDK